MFNCTACGKETEYAGICGKCLTLRLNKEREDEERKCLEAGETFKHDFYDLLEDKIRNLEYVLDLAFQADDNFVDLHDVTDVLIKDFKRAMLEEKNFIKQHFGQVEIEKARGDNSYHIPVGTRLRVVFKPVETVSESSATAE